MNKLKQKALAKIDKEMTKKHSSTVDVIHNFLCETKEEDVHFLEAILKEDRSIEGSVEYCCQKARAEARSGDCSMVSDEKVYSWVREYFMTDKIEGSKASEKERFEVVASRKNRKVEISMPARKKVKKCESQLSLF